MSEELRTPRGIVVPAPAITWRFSRATGPGGQGVNTTDSRVELVVDLTAVVAPDGVRDRVVAALGPSLRIVAAEERSQLRNREAAARRLVERLDAVARPKPRRRPSRRTRSSIEERLAGKRHRSELKSSRRPLGEDR